MHLLSRPVSSHDLFLCVSLQSAAGQGWAVQSTTNIDVTSQRMFLSDFWLLLKDLGSYWKTTLACIGLKGYGFAG